MVLLCITISAWGSISRLKSLVDRIRLKLPYFFRKTNISIRSLSGWRTDHILRPHDVVRQIAFFENTEPNTHHKHWKFVRGDDVKRSYLNTRLSIEARLELPTWNTSPFSKNWYWKNKGNSLLDQYPKMPPKKKASKASGGKDDGGLTRIAIVNASKCKPKKCNQECKKSCPVVKLGKLCIEVGPKSKLAFIAEPLCIGELVVAMFLPTKCREHDYFFNLQRNLIILSCNNCRIFLWNLCWLMILGDTSLFIR